MISNIVLALTLSIGCFTTHVEFLSSIELKAKKEQVVIKKGRALSKRKLKRMLRLWRDVSEEQDVRILSLAWMESRLRPWVRRGDRGRACGIHQIHARYSYPLFRRRTGFNGWDAETLESKRKVSKECARLESNTFSMRTMKKYLSLFDKRGLHPCHHNSGVYGQCNTWYKKRLNIVTAYLWISKHICSMRTL